MEATLSRPEPEATEKKSKSISRSFKKLKFKAKVRFSRKSKAVEIVKDHEKQQIQKQKEKEFPRRENEKCLVKHAQLPCACAGCEAWLLRKLQTSVLEHNAEQQRRRERLRNEQEARKTTVQEQSEKDRKLQQKMEKKVLEDRAKIPPGQEYTPKPFVPYTVSPYERDRFQRMVIGMDSDAIRRSNNRGRHNYDVEVLW